MIDFEKYMIPTIESTFTVEDVFRITGLRPKIVVTGTANGEIKSRAKFTLLNGNTEVGSGSILAVDKHLVNSEKGTPIIYLGLTVTGVTKDQLKRGMKIVTK